MNGSTKLLLACVFSFAVSLNLVATALANPADIDTTFGIAGRGLASLGKISYDQARGAALQPDGKVVVIGDSFLSGEGLTEPANLIVLRLNPDGSRDSSFGIGGIVSKRLFVPVTGASVVIQNDGKIVVGGFANVEVSPTTVRRAFLLVRLLSNGVTDNEFGTDGVVINNLDLTKHTTLTSLYLQADGKIVATGFTGVTSPTAFLEMIVARYNADGSLDGSFDSDGKTFLTVSGGLARGDSVAVQPDGKIVVGGRRSSGVTDFAIVRLNTDGSLDGSFGGTGSVSTPIAGVTSTVASVNLLPDGRIVATGTSGVGTGRNIAVVRYNSNGTLDNTFDSDGIVLTDVGDDIAASSKIQPDGKVVIAGHTVVTPGVAFEFLAIRYNVNGSLDTTFDTDGIVTTRVGTLGTNRTNALLLQSDGRMVIAGALLDTFSGDFAALRYNVNGSLDDGFDGDGTALYELGNAGDSVYAMAVQPDGKIVCAGYVFGGALSQPGVTRFNADGSRDTSFGKDGSVLYPTSDPPRDIYANGVAIQSDGKILFTIYSEDINPYTVVRLNPDGSYDDSFGSGGTVTFPVGTTRDRPAGIKIQPDGKIVVGGYSEVELDRGPSIIRLNSNGTPDATFGIGGKVVTTDPAVSGSVFAMTLQADGKIVLSGDAAPGGQYSFFTTRYDSNGSIDSSFGETGAFDTSLGTSFNGARSVTVQTDGKIVVGGMLFDINNTRNAAAVRYNTNGTLDASFDLDGKVIVPGSPTRYPWFGNVAIQSNGKIVFVGSERMPIGTFGIEKFDAAVFRFNSDGSPDASFGTNGKIVSMIGDHNSSYNSVSLLSNGKILTGGTSSNGLNDDFTVVRYVGDSANSTGAPFDFDGDGKTDIGIFRPSVAEWWINRSSNGSTFAAQFGATTDEITPVDFTGDGKTDIAFWRPSTGEWFVLRSEDFSFFSFPFGANGDVPVPADFDNDGKGDAAVFRPSTSTWFIRRSSDSGTTIQSFGTTGDIPVPADYDGDGKADIAIYRPSVGQWWMNRSTAGILAVTFGSATDKPVQGDYTGDGKDDVAFFRPSTGEWFILRSEDFSFYSFPFGTSTSLPSPGDYDGDGKFDATVFVPDAATWYSQQTGGQTVIRQFGSTGDRPIPNAFVP